MVAALPWPKFATFCKLDNDSESVVRTIRFGVRIIIRFLQEPLPPRPPSLSCRFCVCSVIFSVFRCVPCACVKVSWLTGQWSLSEKGIILGTKPQTGSICGFSLKSSVPKEKKVNKSAAVKM